MVGRIQRQIGEIGLNESVLPFPIQMSNWHMIEDLTSMVRHRLFRHAVVLVVLTLHLDNEIQESTPIAELGKTAASLNLKSSADILRDISGDLASTRVAE